VFVAQLFHPAMAALLYSALRRDLYLYFESSLGMQIAVHFECRGSPAKAGTEWWAYSCLNELKSRSRRRILVGQKRRQSFALHLQEAAGDGSPNGTAIGCHSRSSVPLG